MRKDVIAQWREDIVGKWWSELIGSDLLMMERCTACDTRVLNLRSDGTADFDYVTPDPPDLSPRPSPPFPERWELSDDRVLSIWVPIAPMPKYGMSEWSREQTCYDVLSVTDLSLALSNRRFDGEEVIVLKRVNWDEYVRRKHSQGPR
jgi:hypothetical protein